MSAVHDLDGVVGLDVPPSHLLRPRLDPEGGIAMAEIPEVDPGRVARVRDVEKAAGVQETPCAPKSLGCIA